MWNSKVAAWEEPISATLRSAFLTPGSSLLAAKGAMSAPKE